MKQEILTHIDDPKYLEKLYRQNKSGFEKELNALYPEIKDHAIAQSWHERLNYEEEITWGAKKEIFFVICLAIIAGFIARIPFLFDFSHDQENFFYTHNMGPLVFPALIAYFAWKQAIPKSRIIVLGSILVGVSIYTNLLPNNFNSDTVILSCIHLPVLLWATLGFTFNGGSLRTSEKSIQFLRYNGDFIIMSGLIFLAGMIFSGLTIALFGFLNFNIEQYYFQYVAIWGLTAIPIMATYLVENNPQVVNKISPVIAKIFTPIVLITLVIFLIAMVIARKNLYQDRDFLIIFNGLLVGVMAIILFSISETSKKTISNLSLKLLFTLSVLTIITNGLALSAIIFRLAEYGMSPNRIAVLGANVLIFLHLIAVSRKLLESLNGKATMESTNKTMASFIPYYAIWSAFIGFILPLIFSFK